MALYEEGISGNRDRAGREKGEEEEILRVLLLPLSPSLPFSCAEV